MNYAGKFDAAISLDGQGSHSPGHDHVDSFTAKAHGHVPDGAVVVADPNLIFHGDFKRAGLDLVISHDGHEFVAHDYFRGDKRAAISSPDGAHLTGDIVSALTGYVQVAQAAPAADAAHVIGHVTKLTGSATAIRNGVSVILNNGDNVEKGDVVSTGSDSTLGITFIDGTVFGLSSNARMVLNEMVYDPNGSNNSSLLSLVAGTITFVAGETAKHGDMKVDTPVATMGIRGTAVLNQISFVIPAPTAAVPNPEPQPQVSFQVLVEPNGTTGSYILFDKLTLLPIATVNQAGQMIQISGGNVSITNALLSPDVQKLITDVFTLKFTDNGTNTKLTTNFTDSLTQDGNNVLIKTQSGATAQATYTQTVNYGNNGQTQAPANNATAGGRIATVDSLFLASLDATGTFPKATFNLTEVAGQTGVKTADVIIGKATFLDYNLGDRPTVKVVLDDGSYVYMAGKQDVTATLSALQKHDIVATEVNITVVPTSTNDSNGSAIWTFSVPDSAFDFLAAGETLTLKYTIILNNNFVDDPGIVTQDITIVITGTNDKPVITSDAPTITFAGGTSVPGGPLTSEVPTSGTLTFTDVDLTDTHTVAVSEFSAVLPDGTVPESIYTFLSNALLVSIANGKDSTGTGTGTINWSLKDIPVYLADFIPKGEVLTLTYTVTVTDSQGATSDQTITVTITGTDAPAVVWIATGSPSGGFWKTGANWETGTVPTSNDDVIVITDQLHGLTPSYPVTIDAAAYGKSLTMDDYDTTVDHTAPEVINHSSLTLAGKLTLNADAKFTNAADGTVLVGGAIDVETITRTSGKVVTNTVTITNAGTLTLAAGGIIDTLTTIANSGMIELSGGTLTLDTGIANAGGTVQVDSVATLVADAVTIDGGTVTMLGTLELDGTSLIENGTLNNSGAVKVKGAVEFANETVGNAALGTIEVFADATLTVDKGSIINNSGNVIVDADAEMILNDATISGGAVKGDGSIDVTGASTIDSGATLSVATVTADAKLTLDGVTVSGSVITDNASIELDNTVKLQDSAEIKGGPVTNNGTLEISGPATLLNDVVTNNGTVKVDGNQTLTVSGTEISGGAINGTGTIDVTGASKIDGGATLSTSAVTVEAGATLTLDTATVDGTTISDKGSITIDNTVKLTGGAVIKGGSSVFAPKGGSPATVEFNWGQLGTSFTVLGSPQQVVATDGSGGTVSSAGGIFLRLDQSNGWSGNFAAGTHLLWDYQAGPDITIKFAAPVSSAGAQIQADYYGAFTAEIIAYDLGGNVIGTVSENGVSNGYADGSAIFIDFVSSSADIATIEFLVTSATYSPNDFAIGPVQFSESPSTGASGPIVNNGTLEIEGAATLLNDVVTNHGTVTVDVGQTLTLSGTEIRGGSIAGAGTIDVTGESAIDGGATLSTRFVTVESLQALMLDAMTVDGTTITDKGSVELDDTVTLKGGATIQGASADAKGAVTNNGTLEIAGAATLLNDVVTNNGTVTVDGSQILTLSGTEISGGAINGSGTIDVTVASKIDGGATLSTSSVIADAKLTLDGVTVSGSTITDNSSIELDDTVKLQGGATIQGASADAKGAVTNNGTLEIAGAATLLNDTVTNNGTVQVDDGKILTLSGTEISGGAINGSGTIDVTVASKIDSGATLSTNSVIADAKLTLDGVTVSGSTITDNSSIELDDTVKLQGGATIQGASADAKGAVTNNGTLEIAGAATLLNDTVTNNGTVQVDDGKILTLSGTEISGGTINNFNGLTGGTIDVTGDSTIDTGATLNKGAVTVESGITLTFGDATVSASKINNSGAVKVETDKKLTLAGASLTGGALTIAGTLASSGNTTITDANISNLYLLESTLGGLLTLVATTSTPVITNDGGTIRANNAELDINTESVTNTGTLAAINDGTLKLISTQVTNTGGAVSVELGSMLDLSDASVTGGTLTIAGTLESTGTSAITSADITNTGTITVTSGKLTIDPALIHTLTNSKLLQANGGELDITGEAIVNTADIKALNGGILKLSTLDVTNGSGTVTIDGTSKLYLTDVSINGGSLNNSGNVYSVSGGNNVTGAVINTGTIEVQADTLNLSGGLTGAGTLIIDDKATLELAGANAQTVTFAGGADTLQLDKVAGQSFTGTITGQASTGGTFTITGAADITASSNDALDFTASGGSSIKPANIVLTPTGALTGAAGGIGVTQNGTGDISLTATGNITGLAGNGITLSDSASGVGNITINNVTGKATGTGATSEGILVQNLNAANAGDISITQLGGAVGGAFGIDATTLGNGDVTVDAGGTITGSSTYAIRARSYGSGDIAVTTEAGSVVTSGSSGIIAVNRAITLDTSSTSSITVNAHGTINSGSSLNQSGNTPAGIQAGYAGAISGTNANTDVNGTVVVNNDANITAAGGHGIDAYNYGNGDVTVNDGAGTTIVGAQMGIRALALSGGNGNVSVSLGDNASVTGTAGYGIDAFSLDKGNISVSLSDGDTITSGSSGILAVNEAIAIASGVHSTIQVTAHGTIHSGSTSNLSGATPGGIVAGYNPHEDSKFSNQVYGDVTVTSDATITAAAGYGIEAFTWGIGKVTVTTGEDSSITAAGTAIGAFDHGGGDVSVTNEGSATGSVALGVVATGAGNVTILNDGDLTATGTAGIVVTQNDTGATGNPVATGSTHITNTGSVVGASGHYAIFVQENTQGSAVIDNSGTIGPDDAGSVTATTYAIAESGGHITINNTGDINGNIAVATAKFNNEAGGTWTVSGTSLFGSLSSIVNDGVIDLLNGASISGAGLGINNSNEIESWGTNSINGSVTNTGTIEVHSGTLNLSGGLSGVGTLIIDDTATLELAGATAQTVTFAGGADTLRLDKVAGQSFTGTITGQSSKGGTFTVTGAADITASSGDALDFTASGGSSIKPANIVLTPTGALTGATSGIGVTQNDTGDISLTATGNITGLAGNGITLSDSASGVGNITINNVTGKATGTGATSEGILVQNLNAANAGDISITQLGGAVGGAFGIDATTLGNGDVTIDAGGTITGSSTYAIRARSYGGGDIAVTTEAGGVVTSGSSGIVAVNRAISLDASNDSTVTVNAHGVINSGSSLNQSGNPPAGIQAGYAGATSGTHANTNVNGTVVVNNYADITAAAGSGIDAYNYGNGDVTVNSFAGTTISVAGTQSYGIQASALSGGTGDVTIALGANVTISGATAYGIKAYSIDAGDISVTLAKGDSITSGSTGIVAVNYATSIGSGLDSTIIVEAHGTIHSGTTLNNDNATPGGIIAGYKPGGNATFSGAVNGDVTVDSDAKITADAGYGIEAFTWGAGDVTVSTGETSSITAAGTAIGAFDHGGGDVSVTNDGSATGAIGLSALTTGAGDVTIVNDGHLTGTGTVGISVTQNAAGATGSTHITNTGSVVGANGYAAIAIHGNATGTATIDNSGTIGPADASTVVSTTYAIFETGGAITINNTGDINGNISVASATFNNELGGTWTVSGTSVFGTLSSIDNAGEIDLHGGASISSADGLSFAITNSGEIESWGTTSITGSITNTNTIEIHADGTLSLFGSLSGAGSVTIDAGATLVVDATVSQTITFNGDGSELSIKTADFGGSIAGLAATDKIDLSSIDYGLGTSAVYVANKDANTGGTLTISDAGGHHISLTLTGADYSHTNFAGSDDGAGHTLITVNAADDAPTFTTIGATLTASFSELANTTNSLTPDPAPAATGSIAFTDVDLVDRPTATVTHQDVTWLASDHITQLTLTPDEISALGNALSLQPTGNNNGTVGWTYSIADSTLDFLAQGQTATVVSTITLDDGHNKTDTTHVTVTISGVNDAPTLDNATLAAVSEDPTAPAGSTVGQLFTTGFHDVDNGSSLSAVAITADHATADQGVWQYEVAGSSQWIDISGVSDTGALVLATDTLIRFVPAANYSGVPGSLDVHALDNTYSGGVSGDTPVVIDITSSAIGSSVSAQPATLNTEVTPVADPPAFAALAVNYLADSLTGNSIDTTKWHVVLPSVPGTDDDASVTPTANGVVLHDHGYLETTSGFTPTTATPLHVGLSFSLDDGIGPYVAVTDGTDGTTGAYGSPVNGLSFMFGWGNGLIITNNATGANVNLSASLSQGTVYDATITDDGSHQTVVIVDHSTGETVGTYTSDFSDYAAGNLVTITNREANDSQHDATVSNVTISNAYEGDHGTPIALSGLTAVTDTDGSEHMSLDLSGFPDGTTFSVGQAGTGAEAGHWLISSSDIATLGASPLTMTAPADYTGEFSLHVSGTVVDEATGLGGSLSDTKTFTSDVAVKVDGSAPAGGPVIDTDSFYVSHDRELGSDTIFNLSITDTDSNAPTDDFTVTAVTAHAPTGEESPGSSIDLSPSSGSLDDINTAFANGVTYNPGNPAPNTDMITLTVTDKTTGAYDTVHFVFDEAGDTSQGITLTGTSGKDVIFATTTGDTLTGGGGKDQFVFSPGGSGDDATHTITDFIEGLDKIDLRQFSGVSSIDDLHIVQQSGDTLVTWQQQVGLSEGTPIIEHETLLLSKVTANLQAADFIFGSSHIA